jgi:hypothetical protein
LDSLTEGLKIAAGFSLGDLFPSWKMVSLVSGSARRAEANHRKIFELWTPSSGSTKSVGRRAAMWWRRRTWWMCF